MDQAAEAELEVAEIAEAEGADGATPWHLWVIGVLAVMFSAFGAYDYVMSQLGDRAYIGAMVEPFGIETDLAVAYFSSYPLWADFIWALGVWGAVAGSLLLLARRAWAYLAYLASLLGLVGTNLFTYLNPVPGFTNSSMSLAMVAVVLAVMLALTVYARTQRENGVLR